MNVVGADAAATFSVYSSMTAIIFNSAIPYIA
jgi:hypothetical protein